LRMLLGPLRVTAAALSRSSEQLVGEDCAAIQLQGANGAGVTLFASFVAHGHPATQIDRLEILGDKGAIKLDGARLTCSGVSPQERVYDLAIEYQGSYNRTIAHFVQSLRDSTPFETAPQDNLETMRLVEDCYRLSGWEALQ
ncbi:MAG: Gfo/Idh/MocA family oxidoreductase, partial [Bradyrhizobium sp.]